MTDPLSARVLALRRLARLGQATGDPELASLGQAIAAWVDDADEHRTLEQAVGLGAAQGEFHWRTRVAIAERDALLVQAVENFFPDDPPAVAARVLAADWRRYRDRDWPRHRHAVHCPAEIAGTCNEFFWKMMRVRLGVLGHKSIRAALHRKSLALAAASVAHETSELFSE